MAISDHALCRCSVAAAERRRADFPAVPRLAPGQQAAACEPAPRPCEAGQCYPLQRVTGETDSQQNRVSPVGENSTQRPECLIPSCPRRVKLPGLRAALLRLPAGAAARGRLVTDRHVCVSDQTAHLRPLLPASGLRHGWLWLWLSSLPARFSQETATKARISGAGNGQVCAPGKRCPGAALAASCLAARP